MEIKVKQELNAGEVWNMPEAGALEDGDGILEREMSIESRP